MSFFEKFFERESGLTGIMKGYSDPSTEMVEAMFKGDADEVLAILLSSDEGDED